MALKKYASVDILEVKSSSGKHKVASLDKFADWSDHDYRTEDQYLYVRVRAISSRVNLNHDSWPSEELAKSYRTFVGKPLFVEHNNSDPRRTRGVIVDAKLHSDDEKTSSLDPYYSSDSCWECHKPPTWVELLLEVDAKTYPKFATAIIKGDIDGFSMGANVERSVCSHCNNEASSPEEFCTHIMQKGAYFDYTDPKSGHKTSRKAAEHCFPGDAPITMADGSLKRIADVSIGDLVIDHVGESRAVTDVMSRPVDEDVAVIHRRGQGTSRPLRATKNHPILVARDTSLAEIKSGDAVVEFVPAGEVSAGDWVVEVNHSHEARLERIVTSDWLPERPAKSEKLTLDTSRDEIEVLPSGRYRTVRPCHACEKSMSLCPSELKRMFCSSRCYGSKRKGNLYYDPMKDLPETILLDEDFGRWVGWYLAEGSVLRQQSGRLAGVTFALHVKETSYRDEILRLGQKLFGVAGRVYPASVGNGVSVHFFHNSLGQLMENFGTSSVSKALPNDFLRAPIAFVNGVVSAHLCGDGSDPNRLRQHERRHFTSSDQLADQLYQMNIWLGRTPARHVDKVTVQNKRTKEGHRVLWSNAGGSTTRARVDQWTFAKVSAVTSEPFSGEVFNLEVEDTHTYVAHGQAVHNCYDFGFFELSGVVTPADETAYTMPGTLKHASGNLPDGVTDADIDRHFGEDPDCPSCGGSGKDEEGHKCYTCSGHGQISEGELKQIHDDERDEMRGDMEREASVKNADFMSDHGYASIPTWFGMAAIALGIVAAGKQGELWQRYVEKYGSQPSRGKTVIQAIKTLLPGAEGNIEKMHPSGGPGPYDQTLGSEKTADRNDPPQYEAETAPEKVDTLRQERTCPVCGSPDLEDGTCRVCQYTEAPEGFDNPDLEKAQEVDQEMRQKDGPVEVHGDEEQQVPQQGQVAASHSSALTDEGVSNASTLVTANTGGPRGRIRVEEKPALPAARRISDKPKDAQVIEDHKKPVESSAKEGTDINMSDTQKTADGAEAHGGSDTAPDKRVDVEGVGAVIDGPLEGIEHQDVAKDVNVTGDPTSTWSGTDGQTAPVSNESFPASGDGVKAAATKEGGPKFPDHEPTKVDLHADVADEVGERTKTFGDTRNQADPVTKEVGDLIDAHKAAARKHAFACMKLAEAEIELGLTPSDDKYNRVSELEDASQAELDAQLSTLARVRTAGLRKQASAKKTAATSLPSFQGRRASVEPSEHVAPSSDQQDITDAQAFM